MRSRIASAGIRPVAVRVNGIHLFSIVTVCSLLFGCATPAKRLAPPQSQQPAFESPVVLLFFVDGLDTGVLDRMIRAYELPNITSHFVDGGVSVKHAVTSMPSITYPNAVSLITGRFPGHHGVLGNQWFDRKERLVRDYGSASTYQRVNDDFDCPTMFEILGDRFTVSVQAHTRRGVSLALDNKVESAIEWMLGDYSDVDKLVGQFAGRVVAACRSRGEKPAVYLSYFPGVDEVGHRFGPDSDEYAESIRVVDRAIGRIIDTARSAWGDPVYCVLISDHGHVSIDPDQRVNLAPALSRFGLSVHQGPVQATLRSFRSLALDGADAVLEVGAYRRAAIHLRGKSGWDEPADPTRITRIANRIESKWESKQSSVWSSVELMCYRTDGDAVCVRSRRGRARIERRRAGDRAEYRLVPDSDDPDTAASLVLGYNAEASLVAFVGAGWHDHDDWLAATADSPHPDFVVQAVEMFDSPRAGDLVLFAADEWSFDDGSAGGHGSSLRTDMRIPMYWSGPGFPPGGSIEAARLVDVAPTILDLLGSGDAAEVDAMDGESLLTKLRGAAHR